MKLRYLLGLMSTICIAGMPSVSLAGQWKQDTGKTPEAGVSNYWYAEDGGSCPMNTWKWIDGRCYYFNQDGWMVSAAVTPDGYKVGSSGAWVPDMLNGYPMKISFHTLPFTFTEEGNV